MVIKSACIFLVLDKGNKESVSESVGFAFCCALALTKILKFCILVFFY